MSSKEGIPKSIVKIILENRAMVDWEVETPKLAKAEQQVLFSEENRSCCMSFLVFISPSLVFGLSRAGWRGWFILSQQCFIIPGSSSVLIHPTSCSTLSIWEADSSWPNAQHCVLSSWIPSCFFMQLQFSAWFWAFQHVWSSTLPIVCRFRTPCLPSPRLFMKIYSLKEISPKPWLTGTSLNLKHFQLFSYGFMTDYCNSRYSAFNVSITISWTFWNLVSSLQERGCCKHGWTPRKSL